MARVYGVEAIFSSNLSNKRIKFSESTWVIPYQSIMMPSKLCFAMNPITLVTNASRFVALLTALWYSFDAEEPPTEIRAFDVPLARTNFSMSSTNYEIKVNISCNVTNN